ncbi:MAG TPA: G1 family glutamic endopeptidase [Candidatus Saccharimonadales bacterium]|nr:G1 family glutamic endopeptidase [Candidatus Saccharimonadales bacterium]
MKRLVFAVLAAIMVATLGGVGSGLPQSSDSQTGLYAGRLFHPHHLGRLMFGTSTNWSGYASATNLKSAQINSVSNVAAQWSVPAVTCTPGNQYSAVWIGIDGYSNNTVEQIGTSQDCRNGTPTYYVWYEMYPHAMIKTNLKIQAGDSVNATVQYSGNNYFQLTLNNKTTGNGYTTKQHLSARRQSAEWVVEAPSSIYGVLPLSNFGTATITGASATMNGHIGSISDSSWQNDKIIMQSGTTVKATPTALTNGGSQFSDTWNHL